MEIPTMDLDLEVIGKLSDLPNAYDGLSAEELKAKFDEAGLEIQKWINNVLVPALTAAGIPFDKTNEISAANIQDAIVNVQAQIKDAATGSIVNGSVTKEKLAAELLERVYGGSTWVSMSAPTSSDNPDTGYPVGQLWLQKGFTMHNYATYEKSTDGASWTINNGTMTDGVFKGDGTAKEATAVFSSIARESQSTYAVGQKVVCAYTLENIGSEVTSLTAEAYEGPAISVKTVPANEGYNYFETTLSGPFMDGMFSLTFKTQWGSATVATDGWTLKNFILINVDELKEKLGAETELADWESLLKTLGDFEDYTVPDSLYIQVSDGVWWKFGAASEVSDGYARVRDGVPYWSDRETVKNDLGVLNMASGTYTGDGTASRTVELGVVPKVLFIGRKTLAKVPGFSSSLYGFDNGVTLQQGTIVSFDSGSNKEEMTVQLSDSTLTIKAESVEDYPPICNENETEYVWTAIY